MSSIERRRQLDEDLDRVVRTSGRVSIGAAAVTFVGAGLVWGIGKAAGSAPTIFDYGAALLIIGVVSPALLLIGLDHRKRSASWALREQLRRDRPRDRPLTDKRATLRRRERTEDR
jgi:hypothetical protein